MNENNTQPRSADLEDDKKLSKTIDQLLSQFKENKKNMEYIRPQMLPGIDLYMDQVTTFMEQHLGGTKRYPQDKILTKTMINNYAKNDLLPAFPRRKNIPGSINAGPDLHLLFQKSSLHHRYSGPPETADGQIFQEGRRFRHRGHL